MTDHYTQTVEASLRAGARKLQIGGLAVKLAGIGLLLVAIFVEYYVFFAVAALLALGIFMTQRFYSLPKQFEYDCNAVRLVVVRTNIANRRTRMLEAVYTDVTDFGYFTDCVIDGDILASTDIHSPRLRSLVFKVEGVSHRLLFEPDEYLEALLYRFIADAKRAKAAECPNVGQGGGDEPSGGGESV